MNLARAADRRAPVLVGARGPFRAPADSVDYAPLELARLELTGTTSLDRPAPPPRDSSTEPTTESRLLLWTKSTSGEDGYRRDAVDLGVDRCGGHTLPRARDTGRAMSQENAEIVKCVP